VHERGKKREKRKKEEKRKREREREREPMNAVIQHRMTTLPPNPQPLLTHTSLSLSLLSLSGATCMAGVPSSKACTSW
jgi:hypothetical protein